MRYYIKCKLDPKEKQRLADSIKFESLARGEIFYQGMQTALREGTIDENDIVHFIEICCTRNIKLPGHSLIDKLGVSKKQLAEDGNNNNNYIDMGRLKLNRKKQIGGIEGLRSISDKSMTHITNNLTPTFAGAAISGFFAIFYDNNNKDYFRIKNIHDTEESRQMLETFGLKVNDNVNSIKITARSSLAKSDKRSNVI
jgi:hypothetical protein